MTMQVAPTGMGVFARGDTASFVVRNVSMLIESIGGTSPASAAFLSVGSTPAMAANVAYLHSAVPHRIAEIRNAGG